MKAIKVLLIIFMINNVSLLLFADEKKQDEKQKIILNSKIILSSENENRANNISQSVKCLVCQNQSIYESNSKMSIKLKNIIRKKIYEGQDDKQIYDYLTNRYGDYILMDTKFNYYTLFIWIFPFIAIIVGFYYIYKIFINMEIDNNIVKNKTSNFNFDYTDNKLHFKNKLFIVFIIIIIVILGGSFYSKYISSGMYDYPIDSRNKEIINLKKVESMLIDSRTILAENNNIPNYKVFTIMEQILLIDSDNTEALVVSALYLHQNKFTFTSDYKVDERLHKALNNFNKNSAEYQLLKQHLHNLFK